MRWWNGIGLKNIMNTLGFQGETEHPDTDQGQTVMPEIVARQHPTRGLYLIDDVEELISLADLVTG